MKLTRKFLLAFALLPMAVGVSSCKDDDQTIESIYELSCSPDLLDFVSPTVHYRDDSGVQRHVTLKPEDFKEVSREHFAYKVVTNGDTARVEGAVNDNIWTLVKRSDSWHINDTIRVTYTLLPDKKVEENNVYRFYNRLTVIANILSGDKTIKSKSLKQDFVVSEVKDNEAQKSIKLCPYTTLEFVVTENPE